MRRRILTTKEQEEIFNLNYSDEELVKEFTIEAADLIKVSRVNKDYNQVSYILQKYILKSRGFTTVTFDWNIPKNLIEYVSIQLGLSGVDISKYSRTARHEDLRCIMKELGYKKFQLTNEVKQQAFDIALTNSSEREMMYDLIYYLRSEKIALSSITTLEKLLWGAINDVNGYIYTKIVDLIYDVSKIETFLEVREGRFSDYNIVKNSKSRGIEDIQTKIKILEKYNLDVDLSFTPNRKLQAIYEDVVSCTREKILRFRDDKKRLAYLVIFVKQELKRLEDELIIIDREQEKNRYKKIEVTEFNIVRVYNRFIDEVVFEKEDYKQGILVSIFLDLVTGKSCKGYKEFKRGYFIVNGERIYIDESSFEAFINGVIVDKYTEEEKIKLISVSDKLHDISVRRAEGMYFTPRIWVNEGCKMLEQTLGGVDFKERYIVWDCASGKGNLTNEYTFKELYSSSLNIEDLKYVKNGVKFQFDFLNDDIEKSNKIPPKLVQALKEDKPIIFLMNPPYLSSSHIIGIGGESVVTPTTIVGKQMQDMGLTKSAYQLYTQFLYRVLQVKNEYNLSNVHISLFSPTTFMVGERFFKFRERFLNEFDFKSGIVFSSNSFHGVYGSWEVSFTIWSIGECKNKNEFLHLKKQVDKEGKIVTKGIRVLSNKDRVQV